jgi:hypothetical protein
MFKIKNRILDYFIENINLGYTEKMHKKVLSLVKEAHKSEKIYSEKYKSR